MLSGMFCDDISFCPKECKRTSCMRNKVNIQDKTIPHSYFMEIPPDCPKEKERTATDPEWIPMDNHPSSISFICPHCQMPVYYHHGSSSASRRKSNTMKRCPFEYCPWCGKKVTPYRVNYIDD